MAPSVLMSELEWQLANSPARVRTIPHSTSSSTSLVFTINCIGKLLPFFDSHLYYQVAMSTHLGVPDDPNAAAPATSTTLFLFVSPCFLVLKVNFTCTFH